MLSIPPGRVFYFKREVPFTKTWHPYKRPNLSARHKAPPAGNPRLFLGVFFYPPAQT